MSGDRVAPVQELAHTLLRIGRNRRDLFLLEARDEGRVCGQLLLLAGGVALCVSMAVMVATVTVVALCLEAGRFDLLFGLVLIQLAGALLAFRELLRRVRRWRPFPITRTELGKDVAW
ncbi:MAG: phage holin family protein [Vicinamibacterales bacterium]